MGRLVVIVPSPLVPGYRLAGATTWSAGDIVDAARQIRRVFDEEPDIHVVAVHEPWLDELPRDLQRAIDERVVPVVVGLPVGADPEAASHRRARLVRMLHQAIGYRITFRPEER